jgi:spermidine synthase
MSIIANRQKLLLVVFFFSGFAALLYQVIWQRWLVFYTGISTVSLSLIVSAFMAGLGAGYCTGGWLSDKCSENRTILFFVFAEAGIGLFALFSKYLMYDTLYATGILQGVSPVQTYLILFFILLLPTFFMGLSLPLLSKSFRLNTIKNQASFISLLYFMNNLGAAAGALLTGAVFIRWIGFQQTVIVGSILNFSCAIIAYTIYHSVREKNNQAVILQKQVTRFVWNRRFLFWLFQYGLSGFFAISFEIIWFRLLDVIIKSVAVTFSIILAVYLGTMAIGTFVGVHFIRHYRSRLGRLFLMSQYTMYLYTIGSIAVVWLAIRNMQPLTFLFDYLKSYELSFSPKLIVVSYGIIPLFLMAVPTFLMGFSFTVSQTIVQDDFSSTGRKVGWLQFLNIAGSVFGAWFASLIGIEYLGSSLTIRLLSLLGFFYLAILFIRKLISIKWTAALGVFLLAAIVLFPDHTSYWMRFSGIKKGNEFIFHENHSALSSIKTEQVGGTEICPVFVNGLGQSALPFAVDDIHVALGAIPVLIHPSPETIGVIGLGSGGTLYGISSCPQTKHIDCFEIITNQPIVLKEFARQKHYKVLDGLLKDKRVGIILKDGRYALQNSAQKYDIIEADALRPFTSYAGNVYSIEYFKTVRSCLSKGGIVAAWMPTNRVHRTFTNVFPYVYEIGHFLLLGSDAPIKVDPEEIKQRLETPEIQKYFKKAGINITSIMKHYFFDVREIQSGMLTYHTDVNTDMFPRDEYDYLAKLQKIRAKNRMQEK